MKQTHSLTELQALGFGVKTRTIGGNNINLIYPTKIGVHWSPDLLQFRSSMWTDAWEPVSLGFKKFFNLGEAPDICPDPCSLDACHIVEKLDGTCLIVSRYKGELIVRTRGTTDFQQQENAGELSLLQARYPEAFDNELLNSEQVTMLFEFTTPSNIIVLDYGPTPDIRLIGCVNHVDYSYMTQPKLDQLAELLKLQRPKTASYPCLNDVVAHMDEVLGIEGYCLYFNNDQQIKKVKSKDYLVKHRFKSSYSIERVIDLFIMAGTPSYVDFMAQLEDGFDFECMMTAASDASKVCEAWDKVKRTTDRMHEFVRSMDGKNKNSRKQAALDITEAYGKTGSTGLAFKLLDGQELTSEDYKKLLLQCLN